MGGISGEGTAYSASDHPHTMGGISGEGTAYSASDHEITSIRWVVLVEKELLITPMFSGVRVAQWFDFCVLFCRQLLVFMFFFFLVSFELQLQITLCYLQTFIQRMFIGNM